MMRAGGLPMRNYAPLKTRLLDTRCGFCQPDRDVAARLTSDDPALGVMTDLKQVTAVTIDPDASIKHAMRVMVRRNVRLLLAVDVDNDIQGLITATDVLGEKPMLYLREHGGRRGDIRVRDLMTPRDRLEAISYDELRTARVGHIAATLRESGRQHALVVETDAKGQPMVRGILSASQLSRQLGEALPTGLIAHTFAEIEAALAGHR